jgi:hypothetical protein
MNTNTANKMYNTMLRSILELDQIKLKMSHEEFEQSVIKYIKQNYDDCYDLYKSENIPDMSYKDYLEAYSPETFPPLEFGPDLSPIKIVEEEFEVEDIFKIPAREFDDMVKTFNRRSAKRVKRIK